MATPTAVQSVTVALRAGVSDATLPNNRKMRSGISYAISLEDWAKISNGARASVVDTPTFNTATWIVPLWNNAGYVLDLTTINNYSTVALLNADAQAAKKFVVGDVVQGFNGTAFKLVLVDASSSTVGIGTAVMWGGVATRPAAGKAAATVTSDVSDITDFTAPAETPDFAGVAIGTITAGQYGWIQTDGIVYAAKVAATADAGLGVQLSSVDQVLITSENEVQTLTLTAGLATETFKLTFNGHESSAVTLPTGGYANTTAAQIKTALISISDWTTKTADIAVVKSTNDYVITFTGTLGSQDIGAITVTSKTGAADGSVAETNKGAGGLGANVGTTITAADTGTANIELRSRLFANRHRKTANLFFDKN